MDSVFKNNYLPDAVKGPEFNPSFKQTLKSAFNLENDVTNLLDFVSQPTFQPNLEFDFQKEFAAQNLPIDWQPLLAGSLSKEEFDYNVGKVQAEYKNRAVLASAGWGGTVAALSAGMLSPTIFIPFAGQARGAKAFAEILALGAVAAGAQNGALFLNQATRTEGELYEGIAMDTLLMGLLGGAWLKLSKEGQARLAKDVVFNQKRADVPTGALDLPGRPTTRVREEAPDVSEIKREVQEQGIRDPAEVRAMVEEVNPEGLYVPLRDRALEIGAVKRVTAKSSEDQLAYGKSFLQVPVAEGVTARFVKVPAGSGGKWFTDGEYAITLHGEDGAEIRIPGAKIDSHAKAGATGKHKEADLKKALEEGELDDQLYKMLEEAEDTGMARSLDEGTISSSSADARSVGAATVKSRNTLGAQAAPNRVRQAAMDALGHISPSYRMLTQRTFASLRHAIAKIDMSGVRQAGLETMEASAKDGTVIERIKGYDTNIAEFAITLDKEFYRYIHGTDKGFDFNSPAVTQLKAYFGKLPPGKMNWKEFKEAVFDAHNSGEVPPELSGAVAAFEKFFKHYADRQKQYLKEFADQGLDVAPLFKMIEGDELGKGVENYAHHIFSKHKLMEKMDEFINDFSAYNETSLTESFTKAQARFQKRQAFRAFEKEISQMDPEAISARLDEVEGDLEFLEELPEWQDFREARLALTRQAREEGWPKEQLKTQMKDLQDNLTDDVKVMQSDRKALMATAKILRKFGGDAAEKVAKLKGEIDKADEAIDEMFRSEIPGILRADLTIGRVQKAGDTALSSVNKSLTKVVKTLQARQARMKKLLESKRTNSVSRQKVADLIVTQRAKYDELLTQLENVKGQQVARDDQLRALHYVRESVIEDSNRLVRKRAAKLDDLEDRLEAVEAKVLTPEERARMGAQVEEEMWKAESDFQMQWSKRGEMSGDPVNTRTPDFKERAKDLAAQLHQKLMNTEIELSPAYKAVRQDARSAQLLRTLRLPYNIKGKYLEKDVELSTRAYDRVMGPDLELWRAFEGSPNGASVLGEMQQEATEQLVRISEAKFVRLPAGWVDKSTSFIERAQKRLTDLGEADGIHIDAKNFSATQGAGFVPLTQELRNQLSASVHAAVKASTRDFDIAIQRLRATRTVPDNPDSLMWRSGKMVKALNVVTMMGGVVPASISDVARPVWRHGAAKVFQRGWAPYINRLNPEAKEFRIKAKEVNRKIGLNLEPVLHGRAQAFFGVFDNVVGKTKAERGVEMLSQKMGLIAMYDYWTAAMKSVSGNVFHATMAEYVPAVSKAMREGAEFTGDALQMRTYLRNLGLSDNTIQRLGAQMEKEGGMETFSNGGVLPNMDAWDDMVAYQAYQAAAIKEVNELIVTPGLERPNWTDENIGYSMIAQFKSFTFSATSRMAMSGLQGNDPYLLQGVAFSLAMGAVSYYTYAIAAGGKTLEEANKMEPEKFLWEAVMRSGIIGALGLGAEALEKVPAASGEQPTAFSAPGGLLGAFLGPTYGKAEALAGAIMQMNTDNPRQQLKNLNAIKRVFVPMQNHFLFRRLFDEAGSMIIGAK